MPSTVLMKALGLNTSPNQIEKPEGSLEVASNVVIRRDNVIEPRRGFKLYGNSASSSIKQVFNYRDRILRHYSNKIQFDNGSGTFSDFTGTLTEAETGLRTKSIQSNGNIYLTSSEGIKKISAKESSSLSTSTQITNSGGLKALNLSGKISTSLGNGGGFLEQDSAIAYRVVWGIKDANENLVLGTPSERTLVYNYLENLLIKDINNLLIKLDSIAVSGSFIADGNYTTLYSLDNTSSASSIRSNLISVATKIDADIGDYCSGSLDTASAEVTSASAAYIVLSTTAANYFAGGERLLITGFSVGALGTNLNNREFTVTLDSGNPNNIYLTLVSGSAMTATGPTADTGGVLTSRTFQNISQPSVPSSPATNAQLLEIQTYFDSIITRLKLIPSSVIPTYARNAFIDPILSTTTSNVELTILVPDNATTSYFYQIYRSSQFVATGTTSLSTLTPDDELKLVYEAFPTSAEISAKEIVVIDETADEFRGAFLYTNEASGEGIANSNDLPPFALDINAFKGYTFFANTRTRHRKEIDLLGVSQMISDYNAGTTPKLMISDSSATNLYSFVVGRQEVTPVTCVADVANSRNGKYFDIYSANDETAYRVFYDCPITSISIANPTVITSNSHNLTTGDSITILGSNSTPSVDGTHTVTVTGANTFTIPINVTGSGTYGTWYKNFTGKTTIPVDIATGDSANTIAQKTKNAFENFSDDFTPSVNTSVVTITNTEYGYTTDATAETSGFTIGTITQGRGERASTNEVLLSDNVSPAIAVDETARSLVRVINKNTNEIVNAYYISTVDGIPGKINLEYTDLTDSTFYLLANNSNTGSSFSPDLSPTHNITGISVANPTVITATGHGLNDGDAVVIANSTSTPSIDGVYTVSNVSANTFTVPVNVTVSGAGTAVLHAASTAEYSSNERKINRVYYSKLQQPEAVPLLNYLDVGSNSKKILRIFPLRDSLFVFKEDGLYRISGESSPFTVALFDSSCICIAADSVDVANNQVYAWTRQGINTISEAGVNIVSRAIDIDILKLASDDYTNFSTATFGIGYESDNSYLVFTVSRTSDTKATICYRYSNLTNSWTTFDKSNLAGIVNPTNDRLMLSSGNENYLEVERKSFNRLDYADKEYTESLASGNYLDGGSTLQVSSVVNYEIGDVLTQEQKLTVFQFNMLLKKLDIDSGVADSNYFSTLEAVGGDSLRLKLVDLATKLDADTGIATTDFSSTIASQSGTISSNTAASTTVITTSAAHNLFTGRYVTISGSNSVPSIDGTYQVTVTGASTFTIPVTVLTAGSAGSFITPVTNFNDIEACYNKTIDKLNGDATVYFSNYSQIDTTTLLEVIITGKNSTLNRLSVNKQLDFIVGDMTIYKAIPTEVVYSPIHMQDPLSMKHFYEATMMFSNKTFTEATLAFSTDLLPVFVPIAFEGMGNGLFGNEQFGENFFGGDSHSAPFRTYIPRQCQRCRYLNVQFLHQTAREKWSIFGLTLTANDSKSTRAYR